MSNCNHQAAISVMSGNLSQTPRQNWSKPPNTELRMQTEQSFIWQVMHHWLHMHTKQVSKLSGQQACQAV